MLRCVCEGGTGFILDFEVTACVNLRSCTSGVLHGGHVWSSEVTASWSWVHSSSVLCFVFSVFGESSII